VTANKDKKKANIKIEIINNTVDDENVFL